MIIVNSFFVIPIFLAFTFFIVAFVNVTLHPLNALVSQGCAHNGTPGAFDTSIASCLEY